MEENTEIEKTEDFQKALEFLYLLIKIKQDDGIQQLKECA